MTTSPDLPAELLRIAVRVAGAAAEFITDRRASAWTASTKSSPTDVVTDVDRGAESVLIQTIRALRPDDSFVGEEGGRRPGTGTEGVCWVIDPIDGTVNFVLGLPVYSVSVAAQLDGRTLAGCVHDVTRGESFQASVGGGAFLESAGVRTQLRGPRAVPLGEAVVATGFGYAAEVRVRQGRVLAELIGRVGNVRRLGSAALDLCYVAAGRVDAYFEAGLNEWDRAAGVLIAEEAGALSTGLHGRPPGALTAVCGPDLFAEFTAALEALGADRVLEAEAGQPGPLGVRAQD